MPYSTLTDIKSALPEETIRQLTDDQNINMIDAAKVDAAIAKADGEIDTYLGAAGYVVPLVVVPAVVRGCSIDIAIYHLYKRVSEDVPKTRRQAYTDAVSLLKDVRDGRMALPVAEDADVGLAIAAVSTSHFT